MKGLFNPIIGLILMLILVAGCDKKYSNESGKPYSGKTAMRVTHSVKDYAEWLKVYEEMSDSGSWISVYVSPDDPNLVTLYLLTENHADAKKKFDSEGVRNLMKRAGVSSEPSITYFDIKYSNLSKSKKMYRVEITHDVEDYETWRKVFDEGEQRRINAGLELRGIFIDADNPNMVGVVLATDDVDKLYEMMASEEFQTIKKEAGIASKEMIRVLKMPPEK